MRSVTNLEAAGKLKARKFLSVKLSRKYRKFKKDRLRPSKM